MPLLKDFIKQNVCCIFYSNSLFNYFVCILFLYVLLKEKLFELQVCAQIKYVEYTRLYKKWKVDQNHSKITNIKQTNKKTCKHFFTFIYKKIKYFCCL